MKSRIKIACVDVLLFSPGFLPLFYLDPPSPMSLALLRGKTKVFSTTTFTPSSRYSPLLPTAARDMIRISQHVVF